MPPAIMPPADPNQLAQAGAVNPFAQFAALQPPTSPSMGFQTWASDPQNAHKVVPSMTPPNAPLQPNAGMASVNPPAPAPMASVTPPVSQDKIASDQAELQRLQQSGAAVNHVQNPFLRTLGKIGDIAAPFILGGGAAAIPGTTLHNRYLQNQAQGQLDSDLAANQTAATTAHTTQETTNLASPPDKPGVENKTVTTDDGVYQWNPDTSRYDIKVGPAKKTVPEAEKPLTNVPNLQKAIEDRYHVLNPGKPLPTQYQLPQNATQKDYDRVDKAMEAVEKAQGTKAQQDQANSFRQQALDMARERQQAAQEKANKPTPDEQRRADLANNLNENLSTLKDIVRRRPELFGPLAGRWAELKQKFGSDDPDLGTLSTIEHQIGMAQISAHGMRSAQGIQGASDSILNHLHSGPAAINAAVDAAMKSVETFRNDAGDMTPVGQVRQPGNPKGTAKPAKAPAAADPLGIR